MSDDAAPTPNDLGPGSLTPAQKALLAMVDEQANDEGLWFHTTAITEAYLQQALRELHAAIENAL